MEKLKILCLHGYGTNAKFLQRQLQPFSKLLNADCQFYYIDGPFEAPHNFVIDEKVLQQIQGPTLSWFPTQSVKYKNKQFMQMLQKYKEIFQAKSDYYDGILGFSQGAVAVNILIRGMQKGLFKWKVLQKIKFLILVSGNYYDWVGLDRQNPILLPSLHIISPQDFLFSQSLLNTAQYLNPVILRHHFGHRIPKLNIKQKKLVKDFIRTQKIRKDNKLLLKESKL